MSEWYIDFFTELPNAFWRALVPSEMTAAEVDFLVKVLPAGCRVLDVPCGSGRHALELARRGYRVTGLDVSAEAIEFARGAAEAQHLEVDFRRADMKSLPGDLDADAAVCLGNSFGYLEHADTVGFLRSLAGAKTLVIDYGAVAEALLPHLEDELPMSAGGIEATAVNAYDARAGRLVTEFTFKRGDRVHRASSVQHVYTAAEVTRMAIAAGFAEVELYGDPAGTPFGLGSRRLLLVARG